MTSTDVTSNNSDSEPPEKSPGDRIIKETITAISIFLKLGQKLLTDKTMYTKENSISPEDFK